MLLKHLPAFSACFTSWDIYLAFQSFSEIACCSAILLFFSHHWIFFYFYEIFEENLLQLADLVFFIWTMCHLKGSSVKFTEQALQKDQLTISTDILPGIFSAAQLRERAPSRDLIM